MEQILNLQPALIDQREIIVQARRVTVDDIEAGAEWLRKEIACSAAIVFLGAERDGWEPRFYTWPDFTTGFFNHDPSDDELVTAYGEWRAALELEIAVPMGSA